MKMVSSPEGTFLFSDKSLWVWGNNPNGQLGRGVYTLIAALSPVELKLATSEIIAQVAASEAFTVILIENTVNGHQRLLHAGSLPGYSNPKIIRTTFTPVKISLSPNEAIIKILCGASNIFMLTKHENGQRLWDKGSNRWGAINPNNPEHIVEKFVVLYDTAQKQEQIIQVACGSKHLLFITEQVESKHTTLYGLGCNNSGELGLGSDTKFVSHPTPLRPPSPDRSVMLAAGPDHSFVLTQTERGQQQLLASGDNEEDFQLGLEDSAHIHAFTTINHNFASNTVKQIATSFFHTLLLVEDANNQQFLFSCGNNAYGQLGVPQANVPETTPMLTTVRIALLPEERITSISVENNLSFCLTHAAGLANMGCWLR